MKKPGEFKAAQERHRNRQRVTDALRELKNGQTVLLPAKFGNVWKTVRVAPLGTPSIYRLCLGIAGRTCQVFSNYDKDGKLTALGNGGTYYRHLIDIRGVIMEFIDPIPNYQKVFEYYSTTEPCITGYYDQERNVWYW